MEKVKYKIYPSLLDKFQSILDVEEDYESFFNQGEEGYKKSLEEILAQREQELLDSINRVPHEPIEKADRGTAFNEVIDCLVERRKCHREDMVIKSYKVDETNLPPHIEVTFNGWTFRFDLYFCMGVARYFEGSIPQHRCEAEIDTNYGRVLLYGYADEIHKDVVYDIKTTSSYAFGNYERKWQRYLYPYCLIQSGEMSEVSEFEYTPIVLTGGNTRNPLINGTLFRERYDYNHEEAKVNLKNICERLIEWMETNRDKITDEQVFGGMKK